MYLLACFFCLCEQVSITVTGVLPFICNNEDDEENQAISCRERTLLLSTVTKVLWLYLTFWRKVCYLKVQANVESWLASYPYNAFGQQARLPDHLLQYHVQTYVFFFLIVK